MCSFDKGFDKLIGMLAINMLWAKICVQVYLNETVYCCLQTCKYSYCCVQTFKYSFQLCKFNKWIYY